MFRKLLFGAVLLLIGQESSTVKIETVKTMYSVIPLNQKQLDTLYELELKHPEILIWNGIGKVGDTVQLICSEQDMERYQQEVLESIGLESTVDYRTVTIIMDDSENSATKHHQNQILRYHHLSPNSSGSDEVYFSPAPSHALESPYKKTVPINPIPGTNLFTGIYYKIRNKALSQSWLAWSTSPTEYENYCVADNSGSSNYNPGQKWDSDSQWMFVPTEVPGWYLWFNRGLAVDNSKFRPTAMSEDSSASGKMVGIYRQDRENNRLKSGGDWRRKAFWRPEATGDDGYFKIFNKNYGPLTWTNQKHSTFGNFLQVIRDDTNFNPQEMKHKFFPQEVHLEARIINFEFPSTPESMLKQYTQGEDSTIFSKTIPNQSAAEATFRVEETITRKSTFTWGLRENLKVFAKVTAEVGLPLIASGEVETGFELEIGSHQEWSKETTREIKVIQEVKVPAYKTVEVSAFTQYIKNLPLDFKAEMEITGTVEGRSLEEDGSLIKNTEASAELILQTIKEKGFKAELISSQGNRVRCRVTGTFKGTFGFKGVFSIKDGPKKLRASAFDTRRAKLAMCNRIR